MRNILLATIALTGYLLTSATVTCLAQDPVTLNRNKQFATTPTFTVTGTAVKPLVYNASTSGVYAWDGSKAANWVLNLKNSNDSLYSQAAGFTEYYNRRKVLFAGRGANNGGEVDLYDSTAGQWLKVKDSVSTWLVSSQRKIAVNVRGTEALNIDSFHIVTIDTVLKLAYVAAGTAGTDSVLCYNATTKALSKQAPSLPLKKTTVTLVSGVATISDPLVTTSSAATYSVKTVGGTIGAYYLITYSSSTITITSKQSGGTTQTLDTSVLTILYTP